MNLTAHEFIMCQDGKGSGKRHGPLILSEFTGSASVFGGYQLSVNPWNYQQQGRPLIPLGLLACTQQMGMRRIR